MIKVAKKNSSVLVKEKQRAMINSTKGLKCSCCGSSGIYINEAHHDSEGWVTAYTLSCLNCKIEVSYSASSSLDMDDLIRDYESEDQGPSEASFYY